ncbi:Secretion protein HlyD family protein [Candidatus Zixiibacteriota bacterium]|nr:Secretion protein HlyD family protein [candidate division Zixibacteria bacterium]
MIAEDGNKENSRPSKVKSGSKGHGRRIMVALLVLAAVAAVVAGYWYFYLRGWVSTDDAYIDCDPISISSKILGRIVELAKEEGDTARASEPLAFLDSVDLKAQEAQANASLQFIEQSVPVAEVNLRKAKEDFKRAEQQFKGDVITQEQYDHARLAMQLTQAQYNAATSQVVSARSQLGVIQTQLRNMCIIAPKTGIVAKKWVVAGDIAQAGQPIYTLYDLSNIWITANFEETKLASIRVGEPVQIEVDAFPGHKFAGKVLSIGAAAASEFSLIAPNNASGNFTKVTQRVPVRISVSETKPGDQKTFLPGMSVIVRLRDQE